MPDGATVKQDFYCLKSLLLYGYGFQDRTFVQTDFRYDFLLQIRGIPPFGVKHVPFRRKSGIAYNQLSIRQISICRIILCKPNLTVIRIE